MYEAEHVDNGVLIGSILLCLDEGKSLSSNDLIKIQKNINSLDSKKGAGIWLNPNLIKEETEFYLTNKIYSFNKKEKSWILLNRTKAQYYCGFAVDKILLSAVQKSIIVETAYVTL